MKMSLFIWCVLVIGFVGNVYGQQFDISDANGSPLLPGETVEVVNSEILAADLRYSDSWFILECDGCDPIWTDRRIDIPTGMHHFTYINGQLGGYAELYVGDYFWYNKVSLEIAMSRAGGYQYHFYSRNTLDIEPTGVPTPSLTTWGLITLIVSISALMIWKKS